MKHLISSCLQNLCFYKISIRGGGGGGAAAQQPPLPCGMPLIKTHLPLNIPLSVLMALAVKVHLTESHL
jgi:hypothetical protein